MGEKQIWETLNWENFNITYMTFWLEQQEMNVKCVTP
jgi:hypothetical protein